MPAVSARPALIDDLPAIVGMLADDALGQGRENMGPPLHSNYLDAFEAINNDPNQVFVVFEVEGNPFSTVLELNQLTSHHLLQAVYTGDSVANL